MLHSHAVLKLSALASEGRASSPDNNSLDKSTQVLSIEVVEACTDHLTVSARAVTQRGSVRGGGRFSALDSPAEDNY